MNRTVRQYLSEVEQENGDGERHEPVHQQDKVSTTDPDATYASKGSAVATLGYYDNYLIDNASCVIVGVQATAARLSQESVAARDMITRFYEHHGRYPRSLAADTTYGNGEMLQWLLDREITPYMHVKLSQQRFRGELYGSEKFSYEAETNSLICPQGKRLPYVSTNPKNRTHVYRSTVKRCRDCPVKSECTKGRCRWVSIHVHEAARQHTSAIAKTPEFAKAQCERRKVEALWAELKNQIGVRRLRLRRMKFVREQFYLAAAVQNMKRLVCGVSTSGRARSWRFDASFDAPGQHGIPSSLWCSHSGIERTPIEPRHLSVVKPFQSLEGLDPLKGRR